MRKALVVGINNYPKAELSGAVRDATEIANVLERHGDGSPNFDIKLITDPPVTITKALLRENIENLFKGKSDISLLYFSGHGFVNSLGGYIVTPDYQKYDEGISMDDILKYANESEARDKIIILDCCHSGAFGSPKLTGGYSALGEGVTVLTASKEDESAIEIGGRGVFTSLLIDALQGGSADLRGHITPGSIYSYIDSALGPWDQRPVFKTNVSTFISLRQISPPVPLEILRKLKEYFESPTNEYKLDPSYEFTDDSAIEEHVEIFKNLQEFESVGLVVPVGEEHMYFAAMNSKSCRLTALGYQYWRLVKENKI